MIPGIGSNSHFKIYNELSPMSSATTNYAKYLTANPVVRRLIGGFYRSVIRVVDRSEAPYTLLDAGCGEGEAFGRLDGQVTPPVLYTGCDLNPWSVKTAEATYPQAAWSVQSLSRLAFASGSFDLVLCLEVLEHIAEPRPVLAELHRVCRGRCVFSVPHEPYFRLGSLARGKYLKTFGNHPEHVNHWNPDTFAAFLKHEFPWVRVRSAFPWLIAECRIDPLPPPAAASPPGIPAPDTPNI